MHPMAVSPIVNGVYSALFHSLEVLIDVDLEGKGLEETGRDGVDHLVGAHNRLVVRGALKTALPLIIASTGNTFMSMHVHSLHSMCSTKNHCQ